MGNRCLVPTAVLRELEQGTGKDAQPIVEIVVGSFEHLPHIPIPPALDHPTLGDGEREVLAHCLADDGDVAVIDDLYSQRVAAKLGIQTTGVLGILLDAHAEGHVESMEQVLRTMTDAGARFSSSLIQHVLDAADTEFRRKS